MPPARRWRRSPRCFGVEDGDDVAAAAAAGSTIRGLNERIGMDMGLAEAGVKPDDHDRIVADAMKSTLLKNNPVPGTEEGCGRCSSGRCDAAVKVR